MKTECFFKIALVNQGNVLNDMPQQKHNWFVEAHQITRLLLLLAGCMVVSIHIKTT